jgi:hypothetical protein
MRNLILTELKLRATDWANISTKRLNRDPVTVTRGRSATEQAAGPSQGNLTLNNEGGVFSPRNSNSPIAGEFGRNTPLRVSVVKDPTTLGMVVNGAGRAQANDTAGLSVTGDIDIRVELEPDGDWATLNMDLASKFAFFTGQLGWSLLGVAGRLRLNWWTGVNAPPTMQAESSIAIPGTGRQAVRVTLDVDNGAGGNTATFYTAPSIAGPWTQFGTTIVQAGTTSIFDNAIPVRVGAAFGSSIASYGSSSGTFYRFEMRNGIGGAVVASPDFSAQELDPVPFSSSSFVDAQGNTWSFNGGPDAARIWYGKTWTRFVGEVAEWPPRWDPSHSDKYVPITANGILRRLGQGKAPVKTGLRDFILRSDNVDALAAYYPLEGAEGTTYSLNLAPLNYYLSTRFFPQQVLNSGGFLQSPVFTYGREMGSSWIGSGMELNATGESYMRGDVASGDDNYALDFVWQSTSLGVMTVEIQDYNVNVWRLIFDTSTNAGTLEVRFRAGDTGTEFGFSVVGPFTELQDANMHHCRFQITADGADTDFAVYIDGTVVKSGTMAGYAPNGVALFRFFYTRFTGQTVTNIAHLAMWANADPAQIPAIADTVEAAFGYAGETAAERIERVCDEGNIAVSVVGDPAVSTAMGPQFAEPRLAQIKDAEATDFGILTETRDDLALLYRTRASMYAQDPAVVIDYAAKVVAPPFEPVDDDESTRNDVTASRRDGGSFNLALTTGPMSTLDPPQGIGQYEDEVTVNVETDAQLPGAASWWLRLGTLDAARFPSVTFNLGAQEIQDDPALLEAILALDTGDRMLIQNIDAADIPDELDLIVLGYTETFDNATWVITFNCAPGEPYQVGQFGTARFDSPSSTLTVFHGNAATSLIVATADGGRWTTDPAMFPFDIDVDGERITVQGITGAASPQTFTPVVRSVNGVVSGHDAGTQVKLWDTPRFAY